MLRQSCDDDLESHHAQGPGSGGPYFSQHDRSWWPSLPPGAGELFRRGSSLRALAVNPKLRDPEIGVGVHRPEDIPQARIEEVICGDLEHRFSTLASQFNRAQQAKGFLSGQVHELIGTNLQVAARFAKDAHINVVRTQAGALQL